MNNFIAYGFCMDQSARFWLYRSDNIFGVRKKN